jgi:homoserine O-acetyltransferase/O-succinyltransferase
VTSGPATVGPDRDAVRPAAGRRFAEFGPMTLELGETLPSTVVAYETWGRPRRDGDGRIVNAVLVLHALPGDSHVVGPAGPDQPTAGWWPELIGPGRALDPERWHVVAANVLGGCRGTTGPASPAPDGRAWGSRFPAVTIRDQVDLEARLADRLGIDRFAAVLGGSMGGMRALEWLAGRPGRVGAALVLATGAAVTADQIATQTAQLQAIRLDPRWYGGDYYATGDGTGPVAGLGLARRIAHLTYRSELELAERFADRPQGDEDPLRGGRYAVQSYLDHQADKLVARFDAGTYVALTEAMNRHDVGRGRGGVASALGAIDVPVVVAGIDSDRLYPLRLQQELADAIPTCAGLDVITSAYGHDGFLLEVDAVDTLIERTLRLGADAVRATESPDAR